MVKPAVSEEDWAKAIAAFSLQTKNRLYSILSIFGDIQCMYEKLSDCELAKECADLQLSLMLNQGTVVFSKAQRTARPKMITVISGRRIELMPEKEIGMPEDEISKAEHPLLTVGDMYAGALFVRVLEDVVQTITIPGRRGVPGKVKPQQVLLTNRGFPLAVRKNVSAGKEIVPVTAIQQLLADYYAAYPKQVTLGAKDYRQLQAIANGSWHDDPELSGGVCVEPEVVSQLSTNEQDHPLFTVGDPDLGRWFVQTVQSARAERKRVAQHHQIGEARLAAIGNGEMLLPKAVFVDVMLRRAAHFDKYPLDVMPRSYKKLRRVVAEQNLLKGVD